MVEFAMGPLSVPNAVGIIIAHGHPGSALTRRTDVWMSRDGGYKWYKVGSIKCELFIIIYHNYYDIYTSFQPSAWVLLGGYWPIGFDSTDHFVCFIYYFSQNLVIFKCSFFK